MKIQIFQESPLELDSVKLVPLSRAAQQARCTVDRCGVSACLSHREVWNQRQYHQGIGSQMIEQVLKEKPICETPRQYNSQ